jgi:hypothetical protein
LAVAAAMPAFAHGPDDASSPRAPGTDGKRGRISLAVQSLHTGSLITDAGTIPGKTETDTHLARLGLDWMLDDRWELHASLPFIEKRSNGGPGAHRLDILLVPHPDATFLDDTRYHAGWQDWALGVSYHGTWHGFLAEPHATLILPSHAYSFFGNAAAGQRLVTLDLGVDFTRQPLGSNFYYGFGYSYLALREVDGVNASKNHWRLVGGWFASPRLSFRAFANGSIGKGRDSSDFTERTSEAWYHHDQTSRHNYAIAGLGATWRLSDDYSLGASAATMVWGRTVHDLKHAYELQLTRSF